MSCQEVLQQFVCHPWGKCKLVYKPILGRVENIIVSLLWQEISREHPNRVDQEERLDSGFVDMSVIGIVFFRSRRRRIPRDNLCFGCQLGFFHRSSVEIHHHL